MNQVDQDVVDPSVVIFHTGTEFHTEFKHFRNIPAGLKWIEKISTLPNALTSLRFFPYFYDNFVVIGLNESFLLNRISILFNPDFNSNQNFVSVDFSLASRTERIFDLPKSFSIKNNEEIFEILRKDETFNLNLKDVLSSFISQGNIDLLNSEILHLLLKDSRFQDDMISKDFDINL